MQSVFWERRAQEVESERDALRRRVEQLEHALAVTTLDSEALLFKLAQLLSDRNDGSAEVAYALEAAQRCGWENE